MPRGKIIKRADAYRIAVELPPDPITGRRRQHCETLRGSKKDAEKRLTELLALVDQQKLGADPKMTLADSLERWLTDYATTKAPKTYERHKQIAKHQVIPHLGRVRPDKLTPAHFVRLLALWWETDRLTGAGKLSAQSLLHAYRTLHVAFECAVKWGIRPRNALDSVDPHRCPAGDAGVQDRAGTGFPRRVGWGGHQVARLLPRRLDNGTALA